MIDFFIELLWPILPYDMKKRGAKHWFNTTRRKVFYMKIAELLSNAMQINNIVLSMRNRAAKKKKNGIEAWIYEQMYKDLATTGYLSDGTKKFVPNIDQILIKAGETSGELSKTLFSASDLNEKTSKMQGLIKKALAYPTFLFVCIFAITWWFGASLFPGMEDFMPVEQWPMLSQKTYALAKFIRDYAFIVVAIIIFLGIAIWWSMPNLTGKFRIILDKIPPWSLYRLSQGGAWILSISCMVSAGTINSEALNIVYNESKGNRWLQERTKAVRNNISKSQSMGEALTTPYNFPDGELCMDMQDYAKAGNFNEIFEKVGREWIVTGVEKVEEQSKKLNNIAIMFALFAIAILIQGVVGLFMDFANSMSSFR